MAELPKLTPWQWRTLRAIAARWPDAGPKPQGAHGTTLAKLVSLGFIPERREPLRRGRRTARLLYGRTVDGQAALNRHDHEALGLHRMRQLELAIGGAA